MAFSAFWAMLGGPIVWVTLAVTVVSGIGNVIQWRVTSYQSAKIEQLTKELEESKIQRTALVSQYRDLESKIQGLVKYYENMPKRPSIDGDIDPNDVVDWLRDKATSNESPADGKVNNPEPSKDSGDRRLPPVKNKGSVDCWRGWWRLFR